MKVDNLEKYYTDELKKNGWLLYLREFTFDHDRLDLYFCKHNLYSSVVIFINKEDYRVVDYSFHASWRDSAFVSTPCEHKIWDIYGRLHNVK